jgi:nicotinamidase-related amidase
MKSSDYFTAENSALLLIDHQVGTMQLIKTLPLELVRRHTLALARLGQLLGMPIVLTSSQEDRFQGLLMPELANLLPAEYAARVRRQGLANAWDDPAFVAATRATGRRNLIMAGVTTDVCVVFPAISAVDEGYRVQVVLDGGGSPFQISEDMAQRRMAAAGVTLTTAITVFAELVRDWTRDEGRPQKLLFDDVLGPVLAGHA